MEMVMAIGKIGSCPVSSVGLSHFYTAPDMFLGCGGGCRLSGGWQPGGVRAVQEEWCGWGCRWRWWEGAQDLDTQFECGKLSLARNTHPGRPT